MGDNVVCEALEDLLASVSSAEPANLPALFRRLDQALQGEPHMHADAFAHFGRWQFLGPLERRIVLLIAMEGFTCEEAACITGIPQSEARALLGRARMKYADRFPPRIGLVGADRETRESVAAALDRNGYRLLWSVEDTALPAGNTLEAPSAILVVSASDAAPKAGNVPVTALAGALCGGHSSRHNEPAWPVIIANGVDRPGRIGGQVWTMPKSDLSEAPLLRRALIQALLFSS